MPNYERIIGKQEELSLTALLQCIISAYEINIRERSADQLTSAFNIATVTAQGIELQGAYLMDKFAINSLYFVGNRCILTGCAIENVFTKDQLDEIYSLKNGDFLFDVTDLFNSDGFDIVELLIQIEEVCYDRQIHKKFVSHRPERN